MRGRTFVGVLATTLVAVGGMVTGCVIFTGTNSGYTTADAGQDAAIDFACISAASCGAATDGSAQVCCLGALGATCQTGSCPTLSVQLCSTSSECDGTSCVFQICPTTTLPTAISACGLVPYCELVPSSTDAGAASHADSGGADAGTQDAAFVDAGPVDAGPADSGGPDADILDATAADSGG